MNTPWWRQPWVPFPGMGLLVLAAGGVFSGRFLPNGQGLLGHAYAVALPRLLDGVFWLRNNGLFDPPWFTPSFCGGIPAFANPGNPFYSIPQWLTLFMDPLQSIQVTFHLFALVGLFGMYLLLVRSFRCSSSTAWMGAVLFAFNGYYTHQMILGQIAVHSLMLTPWIAWLLTRPSAADSRRPWFFRLRLSSIAAASVLSAYVVWSGALFLVPSMLMVLMVIHLTLRGCNARVNDLFWSSFAVSLSLAAALSAAKWWPGIQFMNHLDPAPVPLSNLSGLDDAFVLLFRSLFFSPLDAQSLLPHVQDPAFPLDPNDHVFGLTPVPLVLLVLSSGLALQRFRGARGGIVVPRQRVTLWLVTVLLAVIPLAMAIGSPLWDPILRAAPIFREGVFLVHGWSAYVTLVILWVCIFHDRVDWSVSHRRELAFGAILMTLVFHGATDRGPLLQEGYDPNPILTRYRSDPGSAFIYQLSAMIDPETRQVVLPLSRNDSMVLGISMLFCNEPVWGPALQRFPFAPLAMGMVHATTDAGFNMKNPACYLAPLENQCKVGDHFRQREALDLFLHYRPFPFHKPQGQGFAEWIGLTALLLLLLMFLSSFKKKNRILPLRE
ncbi:MAG: hypothetical protein HQL89_07270 [Magnetococcales bacterium]|nr:hypothetical protein [Magnetococcales bacterium]